VHEGWMGGDQRTFSAKRLALASLPGASTETQTRFMTVYLMLSAYDPAERAMILSKLSSVELQEIVGFADTKSNLCKRISEHSRYYNQIEIEIHHHEPI
jgi:hypothetical protein